MEDTLTEDILFSKEGIGIVTTAAEPADFFQVGNEDAAEMRIYLRYQLFRNLDDFALRNTSQEQAELLLGSHTKENSWIKIEEAVEVKPKNGAFPESVWREAFAQASKRYPGMSVVGWFHSHPGTGVGLTDQEKEVHRKFFPKQSQVIYVIDPVVRDRNFYLWHEGQMCNSGGFRIYGKTEKVSAVIGREPVRPEEYINERYLERSVEKLQRMLRHPSVRPIDYVILVLVGLCLGIQVLRPVPTAKVDMRDVLANQTQMSQQIEAVDKRVKGLEGHLEAVGILDKELGLPETPASVPAVKASPSSSESGGALKNDETKEKAEEATDTPDKALIGDKVIIHTVKAGETISSIAEKYYGTSNPKVCRALGRFNKLPAPNYEHIVPGDKLKIPNKQKVGAQ